MKQKVAVMASGEGSNAEAIFSYCAQNPDHYQVAALVCDRPKAPVLERAKKYHIPTFVCPRKNADQQAQEAALLTILDESFDWILMAGYMRILSPAFVRRFQLAHSSLNRLINIHPSLLPSFKGKDAFLQAYQAGVKVSGVSLHFVSEEVDSGPIIFQGSFRRDDHDTLDDFIVKAKALEAPLWRQFLERLKDHELIVSQDSFVSWRKR